MKLTKAQRNTISEGTIIHSGSFLGTPHTWEAKRFGLAVVWTELQFLGGGISRGLYSVMVGGENLLTTEDYSDARDLYSKEFLRLSDV